MSINEKEFKKLMKQVELEIAQEVLRGAQDNIKALGLVSSGTLLNSGKIFQREQGTDVIFDAPYADNIEFGSLPGSMPPITPIKDWVLRTGITSDEKKANSIAFAIAKDIEKDGQAPRPFLGPAIEEVKNMRIKTNG